MVVGVLRIDMRLFEVQTLKQKRSVISRLLHRLRSRYPVSAAEVGWQDRVQRALLGLSMTAATEAIVDSVFNKVEDDIYRTGLVEIIDSDVEYLHYGDELS